MSLANLLEPNLYDIYADNMSTKNLDTITINNSPYPPTGLLPTPVANKVLRTNGGAVVSWGDVNPSNLTGGSVGDVLKTVAPSTVAWDTIKPSDIAPGTARQLIQTNSAGTATEFTSNVDIPGTLDCTGNAVFDGDLTVTNDLNVVNGDLTVANGGVSVLVDGISVEGNSAFNNDLNIDGEITLNSVSGAANQTIVSDGAGNQIWSTVPAAGINHGTSNQVFVTNSLGTASTWSNNLDLPGTLDVTGQSHFDSKIFAASSAEVTSGNLSVNNGDIAILNGNLELQTGTITVSGNINNDFGATASFTNENITGNLQFSGVSGSTGSFIKKTGAATQAFTNIVAADITPGTNGQYITTSGGVATWDTLVVPTSSNQRYYNNTAFDVNTGTNIFATNGVQRVNSGSPFTFNVGTGTFTCAVAGTYTFTFNTILSTHDSQSKFIISNGAAIQCAMQTDYVPGLTTSQPFTYTGTFVATVGQNWAVAFVSFGVGGVMNTSGQDATYLCPTTTLEINRL